MLQLNTQERTLTSIPETTLTTESILERYGLQAAIVSSWKTFCEELGESLIFVGQEVNPHVSCRDSIDILALDYDGRPVVIELKRDKNKLQLLQALSYVAMISNWNRDDYLSRLRGKEGYDAANTILSDGEAMQDPRIILVAESYDPEVILTADFLLQRNIDVEAYSVGAAKLDDRILLSFSKKFPLPGLDDAYVPRAREKKEISDESLETTWDDVVKILSFSWASRAIKFFQKFGEGRPDRRYFGAIFKGTPLGSTNGVHIRSDHVIFYFYDRSERQRNLLEELLKIDVEPWGREGDRKSGWAVRVRSESQFETVVSALGFDP